MKPAFIAIILALLGATLSQAAQKPRAVIVVGTHHYSPQKSMPQFASELERLGFDTTVVNPNWDPEKDKRGLPGLEALEGADLGIFFIRFLKLEDKQLAHITKFLESGKPVVCFRTSTHAFNYPKDHPKQELNIGFGREAFGTPYLIHLQGQTKVSPIQGTEKHPILTGINSTQWNSPGTLYLTKFEKGATPILQGTGSPKKEGTRTNQFGTFDLKKNMTDTIAWTWTNQWGGRVFGTSLGHPGDFAVPESMRVMVNGVFWAAGQPVPTAETKIQSFGKSSTKSTKATPQKKAKATPQTPTILFYGNSMIERLLEHGELEARLQIAQPKAGLKIRSLAWTGDEVGNRLRLEGYAKHMKNLIAEWPADTLVLGYGFYESFAGAAGLEEFKNHYRTHLAQLALSHPGAKLVLLSPIASEGAPAPRNADLALYSKAIQTLATDLDAQFVDLFTLTRDAYAQQDAPLTTAGIHLNDLGNRIVAQALAQTLARPSEVDPHHLRQVALAASAKHQRVAEIVRPKNAVVYFGVRARPQEYADEMPRYHKMIALTEAIVHQLAANPQKTFSDFPAPSLPPMAEGKGKRAKNGNGVIKPISKAISEFKVHDDYQLTLFASEEEFPELRNPVQIAFDAKGRLWVVTMPSFPHTVPGLTPPDKILILEDTNQDGKADKSTTYMEGLDALDGVAFHHQGAIISEQPRLWLTQDRDGNDHLNTQTELLRGIDVTDSHHGGMIATDPMGHLLFSDGVFHRSQLETSHGIHRGIDATTYSLDLNTGKISTLWQHTTPNPWNITFDRWGNTFQNYGDGGLYDGTALPWTPLGSYHPYKYGFVCGYGKGSGAAIVSSPNFPTAYDQGVVTGSLLGRYAVTLTGFNYQEGMVKPKDPITLVSSPNAAFRPADLEFGMDGALYISDFCSPIIGHAQHPMRDPAWDHDYGRIWKIVHKAKPLVTNFPTILGAPPTDLCHLLTHRQDLVRKHTRIELRKHGAAAIKAVDQWINAFDRNHQDFHQATLEANFVLAGLGQVRPALLDTLAQSDSFQYRVAATHLIVKQATQLHDVTARLTTLAKDPHPRVLVAVINAISQLRPTHPELALDQVLALIKSDKKTVKQTLQILDQGIAPVKGRSVPVLDVDPAAELTHWLQYQPGGLGKPTVHTSKKRPKGRLHLYRTFVESEIAQIAILGINSMTLDVTINGSLKFSQNSYWSGDQQIQIDLTPGLNVIEIELTDGRKNRGKGLPPVFLYDAVGRALTKATHVSDSKALTNFATQHAAKLQEQGTTLRVTATPGLQFAPKVLRAEPGAKVRLIFENPDIMQHNFLLLKPGSAAEIGALADKMATQPGAMEKHFIPDSDRILVSSKLIAPQSQEEIIFKVPQQPGDYPYICTFPGHWQVMQGILTVAKKP